MAPEFMPFIACGVLIIASVGACAALALAVLFRGALRRALAREVPSPVRFLRLLFLAALVMVGGLLLATGACAYMIRQQFFLNEPMAAAADQGNLAEVRGLLDRGASPDSWGVDYIQPAIVGAAIGGHAPVVRLLLERGANPNAQDSHGRSALQWARASKSEEVLQLLIKAGAKD